MSWNSARNQAELVKYLEDAGYLSDPRVRDVMLQVDRGNYCRGLPYQDFILPIGYNAHIAAPHMHAYALQKLERYLVEGARALDVGAGSGYLTVCMALMVGEKGSVIGLEHIHELLSSTKQHVLKDKPSLMNQGRTLKFIEWDGREGYFREAPYNAIHVGAAVQKIPQELLQQLAFGGRMIIPVGPGDDAQTIVIVDKNEEGEITETLDVSVKTIPLTDVKKQLGPLYAKEEVNVYKRQSL